MQRFPNWSLGTRRNQRKPLVLFDTVVVIGGQQQHVVAAMAENYVEVIEYVTAKNAQVCCQGVREGRELTPDMNGDTIIPGELQRALEQNISANAADSL